MKRIVFPSILCILLIAGACKKKDNSTSSSGGNTNTQTGSYFGTLAASRTVLQYSQSFADTGYGCNAYFYSTPQQNKYTYVPNDLVNAGTVMIDSIQTQFQNNYYNDTTGSVEIAHAASWNVSGAGSISPFTYSYTPVWAGFSSFNLLPDTIHLGQNCTLQLSGMSNAQQVEIELFDFSTGISQGTNLNFIAPNTNYTFTSNSLSGFSSGSSCFLTIVIYNPVATQTFSNKAFFFYNSSIYAKMVYIK